MSGGLRIGSDSTVHEPYHTLVLSADSTQNGVELIATEENTQLMLVSTSIDGSQSGGRITYDLIGRGGTTGPACGPIRTVRHDVARGDPADVHGLPARQERFRGLTHLEERYRQLVNVPCFACLIRV